MAKRKPICIGTGLVALDVIMNGNPKTPPKIFAGGSCGNVITILSFLQWDTYPIARLSKNDAAKELIDDLQRWKVKTKLISTVQDGSTPIIIQRIKKDKYGNSIHRFEFKNPEDGAWLPRYKPVLNSAVQNITNISPKPATFYFDRINRASIELAKFFSKQGSLIFFEPSSAGDLRLFQECIEIADIIKFSQDRIPNYDKIVPKQSVPLEIETMGKDGLKFRFSHTLSAKKWTHIPSFKIEHITDTAGAGDWCSAGIISKIGKFGVNTFKKTKAENIIKALNYGQALGAINCCFDGARGIMYNLDGTIMNSILKQITDNREFSLAILKTKKVIVQSKDFKISSLI